MTTKEKDYEEGGNFKGPLKQAGVQVKLVGDTVVREETHTYAISADGSTSTVFVPFAVAEGSGETLELARAVYRCSAGTPTLKVQQSTGGGAFGDVTGFTGMSCSSTQGETNPTNVGAADKDEYQVVCSAGSWTGWLSISLVFTRSKNL